MCGLCSMGKNIEYLVKIYEWAGRGDEDQGNELLIGFKGNLCMIVSNSFIIDNYQNRKLYKTII